MVFGCRPVQIQCWRREAALRRCRGGRRQSSMASAGCCAVMGVPPDGPSWLVWEMWVKSMDEHVSVRRRRWCFRVRFKFPSRTQGREHGLMKFGENVEGKTGQCGRRKKLMIPEAVLRRWSEKCSKLTLCPLLQWPIGTQQCHALLNPALMPSLQPHITPTATQTPQLTIAAALYRLA